MVFHDIGTLPILKVEAFRRCFCNSNNFCTARAGNFDTEGMLTMQPARSQHGKAQRRVRVVSRSTPPRWGSVRFRPPICAYAPWGYIVRVDARAKSRTTPTRKTSPPYFVISHGLFDCAQRLERRSAVYKLGPRRYTGSSEAGSGSHQVCCFMDSVCAKLTM